METNVPEEIIIKLQNYSFLSNKYTSSSISNVINNKNGVGKFVRLTNEKKKEKKRKTEDTILQSVSIFTFLHHCLHLYLLCFLYLILMFWEVIFVWLNLLVVPALLILINCPHDAAFLNSVLFWRCWELQGAEVAEPHRTVFFSIFLAQTLD